MKTTPRPKAPWYRAKYGDKPACKPRSRIKPVSARMARLKARYRAAVMGWKGGRVCECANLHDDSGNLICQKRQHPAEECHHYRGRLGPLLMDKRFWVPVCSAAHRFIHQNPDQARRIGLLCDVGEFNTPVKDAA